jgi:hypothetical protein
MELFRFPDKLTLHPRMTSKSQVSTASARVAGTLPRFWRPCPLFRPRLAPTASLQGVGLVETLSSQEAAAIRSGPQFPFSFQLRLSLGKLSATNSIAFRVLLRASQASDVGSIPIARSRNHDNSIVATPPTILSRAPKLGFWSQDGPNGNELIPRKMTG